MAGAVTLRPYQQAALDAVCEQRAKGVRRMLLVAATGAGKTVVFSHLADALGLGPMDKVLVLAHRDELLGQARLKYLAVNPFEQVGLEQGSRQAAPMDRVAVASVQTLRGKRIEDFLRRFGRPALVITDEAHHARAQSYQDLYAGLGITEFGDVIHVGVTATPKRADNRGLSEIYDVIAHAIGIEDLIGQGYLVPLAGYVVQTETSLDAVRTTAGDFNSGDLEDAVNTDERNASVVRAYSDLAPGRQTIVFAASVAHSLALREAFMAAGWRAVHVDGAMPIEARREALSAFGRGAYQVLTNCQVATEGYDEPSVSCVIIARPTKSAVLMTQMVGRCTRLHPGKDRGIVIDMVDVTKRHSVVTLPSLFGMPAEFDLDGSSVVDVAKKFRAIVAESPEMESMLHSVSDLDAAAKLAAAERFQASLRHLIEEAKKNQTYVDVNLLRPPALDPEAENATSLNWIPTADDSYMLRVGSDLLRVHADLVDVHSVVITRTLEDGRRVSREIGNFDELGAAFLAADGWIRRNHAERVILVDRAARWRDSAATEKQIGTLRRFRIANPEKLSRGKASELIDMLFAGAKPRGAVAS